jgi:eukaryotic-like serine/threonine-protein kinase
MAQVWRGTDEVLRRDVAIKILHPHLTEDETFVARFRQEAIAVARLSHPAIVNVYDTCSDDGIEAIVMELVRGDTLRQRLDAGPLDSWQAANIATQVADALSVAHGAGLVHRDIKPANVLLCEDGRVKVGDFGIAKAAESADLTQEGSLVGTAKYLAPEQVDGGTIDGRTDLYGLGVVLYEMLCGRVPFEGDGASATALARLHSDPPKPRLLRPGIPKELEAITLKLLARRPNDRFASAAELRSELIAAGADVVPDATDSRVAPPAPDGGGSPATGDQTQVRFAETERHWLIPTLLVVLTAVSLGIAGLLIGSSGGGSLFGQSDTPAPGEEDAAASPIRVADGSDFDPLGDGAEHPGDIPNLLDGDPETTWNSEGYDSVELGNLKPGVGFYLVLQEPADVTGVEIDARSNNWSVELYVASEAAGDIDGWGEPVAHAEGLGDGRSSIPFPEPTPTGAVLFWFTRMGDETDGGRYRVSIADVEVLG